YGGAMHNDVFPRKELRDYSYAKPVQKRTKGRYLEVDLYVPEYIEKDEELTGEPWYPLVANQQPGRTALVRRAANSFIVVFPRTREDAATEAVAAAEIAAATAAAAAMTLAAPMTAAALDGD